LKPLSCVPDDVVATVLVSRELSASLLEVEWWHVLQVLAPPIESRERLGVPRMPPAQEKSFGAELGGHLREAMCAMLTPFPESEAPRLRDLFQ
jgi:hypothetical protein